MSVLSIGRLVVTVRSGAVPLAANMPRLARHPRVSVLGAQAPTGRAWRVTCAATPQRARCIPYSTGDADVRLTPYSYSGVWAGQVSVGADDGTSTKETIVFRVPRPVTSSPGGSGGAGGDNTVSENKGHGEGRRGESGCAESGNLAAAAAAPSRLSAKVGGLMQNARTRDEVRTSVTVDEEGGLRIDVPNVGAVSCLPESDGAGAASPRALVGRMSLGGDEAPIELRFCSADPEADVSEALTEMQPHRSRPQYPHAPLAYEEHEVEFAGGEEGVTLSGSLSVPEDATCGVVLLADWGRQERDQVLHGHAFLRVLADHLGQNGVASLRYDKRGVGKSTGSYDEASAMHFSADAAQALRLLHEKLGGKPCGVLGMGEGATVGALCVDATGDLARFLVTAGGAGERGEDAMAREAERVGRDSGLPGDYITLVNKQMSALYSTILAEGISDPDSKEFRDRVRKFATDFARILPEEYQEYFGDDLEMRNRFALSCRKCCTPWFRYFFSTNPVDVYERVASVPSVHVLALHGSHDLVTGEHNLNNISEVFTRVRAGEHSSTFEAARFPNHNHFFQQCTTGEMDESEELEETMSPLAMDYVTAFILRVCGGQGES